MINITSITKQADGTWRFVWGESGTFRVILLGEEVATTTDSYYDYYSGEYESTPPPLEIVEDGEFAISERNPSYLVLQWNRVDTDPPVTHYEVEWKNGSTWTHVVTVPQADNVQVFTHISNILADETEFELRAVPINNERREGDAQRFKAFIARRPNIPSITAACSGGTLTIS